MDKQIEIFNTAIEYIPNVLAGIEKSAEYYEVEDYNQGGIILTSIGEGIEWISNMITLTPELHGGNITNEGVLAALEAVIDALEQKDTTLICDVLRYELKEELESVLEKIKSYV